MLVLNRRENEGIRIGPDVRVVVQKIHRGRVHVGVIAPPEIKVLRDELVEAEEAEHDIDRWDDDGGK